MSVALRWLLAAAVVVGADVCVANTAGQQPQHHSPNDGDNEDDLHIWFGATLPLAFIAFGTLCFLCGYACGPRSGTENTTADAPESGRRGGAATDAEDPSYVVIQTAAR